MTTQVCVDASWPQAARSSSKQPLCMLRRVLMHAHAVRTCACTSLGESASSSANARPRCSDDVCMYRQYSPGSKLGARENQSLMRMVRSRCELVVTRTQEAICSLARSLMQHNVTSKRCKEALIRSQQAKPCT